MSERDVHAIRRPGTGPRIRRRWIAWTVLTLLTATVVWLVFFWGVVRLSWTEEVEVAPGDVIVIERRMKFVKVYVELFQPRLQTRFSSIQLPGGARFETEDRMSLIYLGRGASPATWMLIAVANYCEEFRKYGLTDYIQLEYADGRWSHHALEAKYFGRAANLLVATAMASDGALVTLGEKKDWNSETYGPGKRYLQIKRDQRDLDGRIRHCTEGWKAN